MSPPINNNNYIHLLYGGAITANIPSDKIDASTIRPIPSHQELYLSSSGPSTSLLFEITERVCHTESDHEALLYHFEDIVEEGHLGRVWETSGPIQLENFSNPPAPTYHLIATVTPPTPLNNDNNHNYHSQILSVPGNNNNDVAPPPTSTVILLSLIRLVPQSSDLLISINIPLHNQGSTTTTTTTGTNGDPIDFQQGRYGSLVQQEGIALRNEVVGSLRVRDWSLFDDDDGAGGCMMGGERVEP